MAILNVPLVYIILVKKTKQVFVRGMKTSKLCALLAISLKHTPIKNGSAAMALEAFPSQKNKLAIAFTLVMIKKNRYLGLKLTVFSR